ncbi:hypothetical protein AAES_35179 [Amazona aestiva]|uniref:PDZ domain-containing protein n=1 Tax=Amazona aestiva TaxID=12930 RepID=A0A0Q3U091_AMAAE|nr:hypothetical protein AAES_35179 [Amazona aestiva]
MTDGCDTVDMTLRRKGLGQLGFHVKYDGTVAEVEDYGFAWQVNLRQGSCLVEICKVAVVTLNHDQMIDLLRISITLKVVIVPPHEDRAPWRLVMVLHGAHVFFQLGLWQHRSHTMVTPHRGGISSHESTMERHNPGRRSSKEEPAGMDSPKQHSKGEALNSSYSSTTTLSSTTSSDERWFNIPDTNDGAEFPDPFPKGSCNDSSIGTPKPHCALSQRDKGPKLIVAPGDDATTTTTKRDQSPPSTSYRCKEGTPPQPSPPTAFDLPEEVTQLKAMLKQLHSDLQKVLKLLLPCKVLKSGRHLILQLHAPACQSWLFQHLKELEEEAASRTKVGLREEPVEVDVVVEEEEAMDVDVEVEEDEAMDLD